MRAEILQVRDAERLDKLWRSTATVNRALTLLCSVRCQCTGTKFGPKNDRGIACQPAPVKDLRPMR
jgi:hypothetical protein